MTDETWCVVFVVVVLMSLLAYCVWEVTRDPGTSRSRNDQALRDAVKARETTHDR